MKRSAGPSALSPLLSALVSVCILTIPGTVAVVSQTMGNITFECPDGWQLDGPDCYLLVDVAMVLKDARDLCGKYGSDVVEIQDEMEAESVARMVQDQYSQWEFYWINNNLTDADSVCGGFWGVGEPKQADNIPMSVSACVKGRWYQTNPTTRLPFVCKVPACVEGTFRCRDEFKCISNNYKCDGVYDCEDESDESNCATQTECSKTLRGSTGQLTKSYTAGQTCTWFIEGSEPGKPLHIEFTSLNLEDDVDCLEVWSGGPSFKTSRLQERLCGQLPSSGMRKMYSHNNFIIVRLQADRSEQRSGFDATWAVDPDLLQEERTIVANDSFQELTSPYFDSNPSPRSYVRHYTVSSPDDADGSLITMEVLQNELGDGFEYDPDTLIPVGNTDNYPDTYVSTSNRFTFYLNSLGRNEPLKFKAKVMKGCKVKFTRTNGYLTSPNIPPSPYPPSTRCTYLIKGPQGAQRAFQLRFENENLADQNDTVTVYDGNNVNANTLTAAASGASFVSSGTEVLVDFTSSLVQSNGSFKLSYNMACPNLTDTSHMQLDTTSTHFQSEVTVQCETGYAFAQEEYNSDTSVTIRCGLGGEWNVSRLPTCTVINCGIPEVISNGYVLEGSGRAQYGHNVTYECFLGFNMTGPPTSTCGDGSVWSERPSCSATQCPPLGNPPDGTITKVIGNGTSSGTIYNYTCNAGYELVGARYRLCNPDGTWEPAMPNCTRIKCPIPEVNPDSASLTPSSDPVEFEGYLDVQCKPGRVINGTSTQVSKSFRCLESGTFEVSRDVCVDQDECDIGAFICQSHEQCKNTMGSYRCVCEAGYIHDDMYSSCKVEFGCMRNTSGCDVKHGRCVNDATCVCDTGYRLFSEDGMSGRYIPDPEDGLTAGDVYYLNHTCVPVTCSNLPTVDHGRPLTNKTLFDFEERVSYRCDFGYRFTNNDDLICNASGHWENPAPVCEAITCDPLIVTDSLKTAIYPSGPTNVGEKVELECFSESTETRYNKTLFCAFDRESQSFRLQGDSADCPAIDCTTPEPLGGASFTATSTGLDASFTFGCLDGFTLDGLSDADNYTVTCGRNGRWGFGNLTCTGARCLDPGTPGGMEQVSANFQVNGTVVYNCTREGFEAYPMNRTCSYDPVLKTADWDSRVPECRDVQKPTFSDCPPKPIKLKLYHTVMSTDIQEPSANDNSGLVFITKEPAWFRVDVGLAESVNVTYTASDAEDNEETCSFTVVVNDPSVLPNLDCPDYLFFPVDSDNPYTINLSTYVNASGDDTLIFDHGPELTVGLSTLGKTEVRVTATNYFGLQRQCAFVVEIKQNACLETDISVDNADLTCTFSSGNVSCTAQCKAGYAYHDGMTSKDYTCHGMNEWSPSLPAQACTDVIDSEYIIVIRGEYYLEAGLLDCLDGIKSKLEEMIPTKPVCRYQLYDPLFFTPQVKFIDQQAQNITVEVSLGVEESINKDLITEGDYTTCRSFFEMTERGNEDVLSVFNVSCTNMTEMQQLPTQTTEFVSGAWSCEPGQVVEKIGGKAKCVKCAPGSFSNSSRCDACPDGQYQDTAGQTECKPCENGAQHSVIPRASSKQCIASCGLGFTNGENFTENPDLKCKACPVDTYLGTAYTAECKPCNASKTTSGQEGAKTCIDKCEAGKYPLSNTACAPCPLGFYKSVVGNEACTRCPAGKNTTSEMSTDSNDCVNFTISGCENPAQNASSVNYCVCAKGYRGNLCNVPADSCLSNPCYNGGTCNSTGPFSYVCTCPTNFNGSRCETDIVNNCTNSTCEDITFCRDLIDHADCVCPRSSLHVYNQPKCSVEKNVCSTNPCKNGATCLTTSDGVQAFTCLCPAGYTGDKCDHDIDDCKNNPDGCLYGGSCDDRVNDYTCDCGDYQGEHCETLPDFCKMNKAFCQNGLCFNDYNISSAVCVCDFPYRLSRSSGQCELIDLCTEDNRCENNSTCTDGEPGVTRCQCPPGYNGSRCQHDINDCASKPCVHGDCHDRVNGYECVCDAGFNGTNCDNDIDDCITSSCIPENTEECVDVVNNYRCICKVGWTGLNCQTDINECLSLPCRHGGACVPSSTPGQYNCTCRDGWVGHDCSELEQFCPDDTCESNGKCHSLQDDFFCECVGGSSGKNCSIFVNVCDKLEPCESPSSCQKDDNAASCNCPTDYTGTSCNLIEDSCKNDPCQNGGTCVPEVVGYTCKCAEGYSGVTDCAQAIDPCDTITCPTGAPCVMFMDKPVCMCGLNKVKSGSTCKAVTTDFDIYFTKPAASVRSSQPFNWTEPELTLSFWAAPLADTTCSLVELRLSNDSLVMSVMTDSIMLGTGGQVNLPFGDLYGSPVRFEVGKWNHFSITSTMTNYVLYHNGRRFKQGTLNELLPPPHQLMASYVGEEFQGYISQVAVFQRSLTYEEVLDLYQEEPLPSGIVLTWSGYDLTTNVWSRLVTHDSATPRINLKVCEDGKSGTACDGDKPDKQPPSVPNCPAEQTVTRKRLAQVNDFFNGQQFMSNINGTVIPVGAHRLVFMAKDDQNNVAFCRFNVYVKRGGQMQDPSQLCGVTDGLNTGYMTSCGTRGQTVQCPNGEEAPLSPKIITCGKLGAYNWPMPNLLPRAIVCGDAEALRYRIHLKLKYELGLNCVSDETSQIASALKEKVKAVNLQWPTLCEDGSCDTANTSDVTCNGNLVTANVVINAIPATLSNGAGLELTAKELIQKSTLEDSAFNIVDYFSAQLQTNEVEITAVPGCKEGYGLHRGMCVMCARGSFLNGATGMCELCPVGSISTVDKATSCEQCPGGQTTIQLGATECVDECKAGSAYNTSSQQCTQCQKDFYTDQAGQVYCKFCPANTDNEGPGSTSSAGCVATCPAGTELNSSVCVDCPRGKYSDGIEIDRCTDCPEGNTTAGKASTSYYSCYQTACNPGHFRNSSNMCEPCDYGQYQPEKWEDKCLSCNESYTTNSTASTSPEQCLYYCEAGHELVNKTCRPCYRGTYKSNEGLAKLDKCHPCANGNTTDADGSDSELDCEIKICSTGQKISAYGDCEDCPPDTYQEKDLPSKDTECMSCDPGLGTTGRGHTSAEQCKPVCGPGEQYNASKGMCEDCPMGTYNTGNATQRFEQCAPCQDGYVTVNETEGATSILDCTLRNCPTGNYIDDADDCKPCPVGEYQEKPRQTACDKCRANTNTSGEGKASSSECTISCPLGEEQTPNTVSDCQPCEPDFTKSPAGPGTCTQCTGNYTANVERTACDVPYCDRGFQLSGDGSTCIACEAGKFKSERGNASQCESCPSNTTTSGIASISRDNCTSANCEPGFFPLDGSLPCQACRRGTYKSSTGNEACTPCSVNTTPNEASTFSGECSVVVCPLGQYREQNRCVNCTQGSFSNDTGLTECLKCDPNFTTVYSGAGSAGLCVPICGLGEYLNETAKDCTECPLGEYNPVAGNISVVVQRCTPCPDGKTTSTIKSVGIADCDTEDCVPGHFRSSNGGCEQCPLGFYQPMKSQSRCLKCADGLSTLLTGRRQNNSCVEDCSDGFEYAVSNKTCTPCPLDFYKNKEESVHCFKCPKGFGTVVTGQTSCIEKTGTTPTLPIVTDKFAITITLLFRVVPCGFTGPVDKQEIANAMFDAIKDVITTTSITNYAAICTASCNNVRVVYKEGCLKGLNRSKRDAHTNQIVDVVVSNVQDVVKNNANNKTASTKGVLERAFYDLQNTRQLQKIQDTHQVEFVDVTNAEERITCEPGNANNGTECSQCQAGTYSSQGLQCELCPENTYQNNAGFNSCIDCPDKTFVSTTGATQLSQCIRKCSESNAGQTYCSGHGQCVFDQSNSDGVRCVCEENYSGNDCSMREASTDNQTYMIAGIVGGSCAFLLLVLVVFGVVVCLRRSAAKGGSTHNSSKDGKRLTREDDGTMSEGFVNYNFPLYNNPVYDNTSGMMARSSGVPPLMYVDPAMVGADDDVRDFYASDRSRNRSRSRSYAEEWKTLPDV